MKIKQFKKNLQNEQFNIPNIIDKIKPIANEARFEKIINNKQKKTIIIFRSLSFSLCLVLAFIISFIFIKNNYTSFNKEGKIFTDDYISEIISENKDHDNTNSAEKEIPKNPSEEKSVSDENILEYYYASLDNYLLNSDLLVAEYSSATKDFTEKEKEDISIAVSSYMINNYLKSSAFTTESINTKIYNSNAAPISDVAIITLTISKNKDKTTDELIELLPESIKTKHTNDELKFIINSIINN